MRAKTIDYEHVMDDNAGGNYDQHVYITHRIANMAVRDIIRQRNYISMHFEMKIVHQSIKKTSTGGITFDELSLSFSDVMQ